MLLFFILKIQSVNLKYFIEIILHHQHDNEDVMMYLKYILALQHHLQYHTYNITCQCEDDKAQDE